MKSRSSPKFSTQRIAQLLLRVMALIILVTMVSCNFSASEEDKDLEKTQTEISAQQTDLAEGDTGDTAATIAAQQATIDAAQAAQAAQATQAALQATQLVPPPGTTPLAPPQLPPGFTPGAPMPPQPPPANFNEMMANAAVLLFEDIVVDPSQSPYVQRTLKAMNIQNVKNDGNAVGWLLSDLRGSAPGGRPWDLVIIAQESRDAVSGEFYDALISLLNQGTAVILEDWNLGNVAEGVIKPTLVKCGVYAYPWVNMGALGDPNIFIMWPLGIPHPVMSDPNSGFKFTRVRDYWAWSIFLGTKMALTGTGDANLLVGTKSQEKYQDGTLAVCMGGRLTIQGFSSHNFEFDTMYPVWENYIYNALKVKLLGGS